MAEVTACYPGFKGKGCAWKTLHVMHVQYRHETTSKTNEALLGVGALLTPSMWQKLPHLEVLLDNDCRRSKQ
jgi:hypothetical protein